MLEFEILSSAFGGAVSQAYIEVGVRNAHARVLANNPLAVVLSTTVRPHGTLVYLPACVLPAVSMAAGSFGAAIGLLER